MAIVTSRCMSLSRRSELSGEVREMDRVKGSQHYTQRKAFQLLLLLSRTV